VGGATLTRSHLINPQQNDAAGHVQHPEKVLGESLIAHNDPAKVLQPGKESFDLPPPLVATQRATTERQAGEAVALNRSHGVTLV